MKNNSKLNICHINTHDIAGGAAKVAWRLIERQNKMGHSSKILAGIKNSESFFSESFDPEPDFALKNSFKEKDLLYYEYQGSHRLINNPTVLGSQILHFHNIHGSYFNPFSLLLLTAKKPSIWTLHDMQSLTGHCAHSFECNKWAEGCQNCPSLSIYPEIETDSASRLLNDKKFIYDNSEFVLTVPSNWLKKKVEKSILKNKRCELIYNGIDTKIFTPRDKKSMRQKYNIPEDAFLLGGVATGGALGNFWKGGDYLRKVLDELFKTIPDAFFINIGSATENTNPRIIDIPTINDESFLSEIYSIMDIYLTTSIADNAPLVVLEALSCGIPVVSFATGGIPDIVENGYSGIITEYKNTDQIVKEIIKISQNRTVLKSLSKNARADAVKKFDLDKINEQYLRLYQEMINNFTPPDNQLSIEDLPAEIKTAQFESAYKNIGIRKTMDLSIVLATKNRAQLLDEMLGSLKKAAKNISYEVIVIDGNSTDNTLAILKKHKITQVYNETEILGPGRHSWPELYNWGFAKASGKWAMYASDDILFEDNCLDNAIALANKQDKSVAGLAFFYRNLFFEADWGEFGIDYTFGQQYLINYGIINSEKFNEVGGLDENYRFYCADGDLCLSLINKGYKIISAPNCKVIHNNVLDNNKFLSNEAASLDIQRYTEKWKNIFNTTINPYRQKLKEFENTWNVTAKLSKIKIFQQNSDLLKRGTNNNNFCTNGEEHFVKAVIEPGFLAFDVGANKGQWALNILKEFPNLDLTSFEPVPELFSILKKNTSGLNIEIENLAVSSSDGIASFFYYDQQDDRFSELSTFYRRKQAEIDLNLEPKIVDVKKTTLSNYCSAKNINKINFLKIDTEGSEKDVLIGAASLLDNNKIDLIQFEYGGTYIDAKITLEEVFKILSEKKYRIFKIIPEGLVHISLWTDELENYQYGNFCAASSNIAGHYSIIKFQSRLSFPESEILKMEEVKIHLGCGQKYLEGYANIDFPDEHHSVQKKSVADYHCDLTGLSFPDESVSEIRLHHVFEHFSRPVALALLFNWQNWLKPGGGLIIETPDLEESAKMYLSEKYSFQEKQVVLRHVFGSHEADWAVHWDGWDVEKFVRVLTLIGFEVKDAKKEVWKLTRNITVEAVKSSAISSAQKENNVRELLSESLVDFSTSEQSLLETWFNIFKTKLRASSLEPLVSVFMPVYNGAKYIRETIESILSQTYKNLELIIADDGSTDNTVDIVNEIAVRDQRVKLLKLQHAGEVNARNIAIQNISPGTKYLLNHDSDDISLPEKLEKLVNYLELNKGIDIVGCFAEYFDDGDKNLGAPRLEFTPEKIKETFHSVNSMINSAALIKKEVFDKIGNYREEYRSVDDYDFFSRALIAGFNLANIPEVLHKIRIHPDSIGSKRAELQKSLSVKISNDYLLQTKGEEFKNLKLHLGCGNISIKGFVNVDIDAKLAAVEVVDNIQYLSKFKNGSASLIYACHVLEHFASEDVLPLLKRWFEVLDYGAELRISVPDLDRIIDIYQRNKKHFHTPPNTPWIGLLYGGQTDEYDYHKTGFNFTYLKYLLEQAGFEEIEEYAHSPHWLGIEDASLANQPFGEYVSLNIKARKPAKETRDLKQSLKVLLTVEFYHPHLGGAELVVQKIAEGLAKKGHDVTVATTKLNDRTKFLLNGVKIVEFDVQGKLATGFVGTDISRYQDYLNQSDFDVVFNYAAQQWATDLAFPVVEYKSRQRAHILAPCGYSALEDSSTLKWDAFKDYFEQIIPAALPLYDKVIYHSKYYKDFDFGEKLGLTNSVIVPNGVDLKEFQVETRNDFREKYNINTKYMLLCVANFIEGKGQIKLVEMFKKTGRDDATLVLIGKEGNKQNEISRIISNNKNITLLANLERKDVVNAFLTSDLFVFASEVEAAPLVILEAMVSGTPFISTDVGNVKELAGGIVSALKDFPGHINYLLDNENIRKKLINESKDVIRSKYNWDKIIDEYEELLIKVVKTKNYE